jgi:hypothetical protein
MIHGQKRYASFADLEPSGAEDGSGRRDAQKSSLSDWYAQVRRVPIAELDVQDVARACRQSVFLDHVLPRAIELLKEDVCAGGLYEGELVAALASIPRPFWGAHQAFVVVLREMLSSSLDALDADVQEDAKRLLAALQQAGLTE